MIMRTLPPSQRTPDPSMGTHPLAHTAAVPCRPPPAHTQASARLKAEGRRVGYGIHVDGTCEWDGATDAFCQFARPAEMLVKDIGPIKSTADLPKLPDYTHRVGPLSLGVLMAPLRLAPHKATRMLSANVEALRRGGAAAGHA